MKFTFFLFPVINVMACDFWIAVDSILIVNTFLEKEAAKLEYYQRCYEVVLWQYILDHGIYGVTP